MKGTVNGVLSPNGYGSNLAEIQPNADETISDQIAEREPHKASNMARAQVWPKPEPGPSLALSEAPETATLSPPNQRLNHTTKFPY